MGALPKTVFTPFRRRRKEKIPSQGRTPPIYPRNFVGLPSLPLLQLTGVPCCVAHTRRDGNLRPAALPAPPSRQGKGSPGPRIRAAVARLTRGTGAPSILVPGQMRAPGRAWGRERLQPASCPHRRPPPNPFTKPEPQGRKGGEAGGAEDGGRKRGGVSGEGAAGTAAGKPGDATALSLPPGAGRGARTAGGGVGVRGARQEAPRSPARPGPPRSPRVARPSEAAGRPSPRSPCRCCPRSGAQQARGGSMPLLPRLASAAPRSTVRRRRALRLTSAGPAEPPLSTERVSAGRGALLRPWGRESWEEWEGSPEGAPPSRLGRRKLHAAGARRDAGSRLDAAPPGLRD